MARINLDEEKTVSFQQFNLSPHIYKALNVCGYTSPTPIQAKSIPIILDGKDLVASAQTGTGKTAAFVLPALHYLSTQNSNKKTRILILTPTRELANQITKAASTYGKFMRFNIVSLVGGMPYHHQIKDLARGADIIVATPGRLMDHMEQKRVDLSGVEMLVLDEADRMLDMGFIEDVQYIAKFTPAKRQTLLFSATLDNKLMNVVRHLLKQPVRIDLSEEKITAPQIKQELYKAKNAQHKSRLLNHFLRDTNIYKAIVFSATKINADKLAHELCDLGFQAAALHGDLKQKVRSRTLEQLRRGKIQILVATDVAARGIDVGDITHVFNYDMPRFCEDYVHRIGRTGRAGKSGTAISFVLPTDLRHLQRIERYIGQRLKLIQQVELHDEDIPFHSSHKQERQEHSKEHRPLKQFSKDTSEQREKKPTKDKFSKRKFSSSKSSSPKKKHFSSNKKRSFSDHPVDRNRQPTERKEAPSSKKKFFSRKKSGKPSDSKAKTYHGNDRPFKSNQKKKRKPFYQDEA